MDDGLKRADSGVPDAEPGSHLLDEPKPGGDMWPGPGGYVKEADDPAGGVEDQTSGEAGEGAEDGPVIVRLASYLIRVHVHGPEGTETENVDVVEALVKGAMAERIEGATVTVSAERVDR